MQKTEPFDKYTMFTCFLILAPRWWDKRVLLKASKIGTYNKVTITQAKVGGERYFPEPLYISGKDARKFKIEHNGVIAVRSIPLDAFKELVIAQKSILDLL